MTGELVRQNAPLVPRGFDEAMRLAEVMARSKMLPQHIQGDVGTAFLIIEQAMRWNMSPFAVAQATSNIRGKLMFSGMLVAAAAVSCGAVVGEFDYEFTGDPKKPETLKVVASAVRASDHQRKSIELAWVDARTDNHHWLKQPEQQLSYAAVRVWTRRWSPSAILGVYSPEEMSDGKEPFVGTTIDVAPEPKRETPPEPPQEPEHETPVEMFRRLSNRNWPNPSEWLELVDTVANECNTMQEMYDLRKCDSIVQAEKNAPRDMKQFLIGVWRKTVERLSPKADDPASDPPAEEPTKVETDEANPEMDFVPKEPDIEARVKAALASINTLDGLRTWALGPIKEERRALEKADPKLYARLKAMVDIRIVELQDARIKGAA